MTIKEAIDQLEEILPVVSAERNYWRVRTNSGDYYGSYKDNNYVAIEHDAIPYSVLAEGRKMYPANSEYIPWLKYKLLERLPDLKNPGIVAGQITRFLWDMKKGDIVIIPSYRSKEFSVGIITETPIYIATDRDMDATDCLYPFRRNVEWVKTIDRERLDPYLYKVLFTQNAITSLKPYAELIERSISDFFVSDGVCHLIVEIEKESKIYASELFNLGVGYLNLANTIAKTEDTDFAGDQIEVKIALDSPGKLHFKASSWRTVVLLGIVVIAINGGGLHIGGKDGFDLSTDGLIKKIIDYKNANQDRKLQDSIYERYSRDLEVKDPKDLIELLRQVAPNKDLPK